MELIWLLMAAEAATENGGRLIAFTLAKADVRAQVNFASPFWPLVHEVPKLYTELLTRLRELRCRFERNSNGCR